MKSKLTALLVLAVIVASCNSSKKANSEPEETTSSITTENSSSSTIEKTKWTLTTMEGHEVHKLEEGDQDIHFILDPIDNKVSGYSGCNTFMGTYTLEDGNRIKFSKMASTRRACPEAPVNESELMSIFEMTDNFTINNGELALNVGKRAPLAIFKKSEINSEPITEKYWKLKTLEGKNVTMAKNQEKEIYFMLKTDKNRVTGFAGCNTIGGEYTLEKGNRIRFTNMLTALKACPDVDVNEAEFLKIFELADNYTIVDDVLSLNVGRRAPLAVFEAVYFQ